jgi:hypothetical protein
MAHFALTPLNVPDQKYVNQVVALAHRGCLFIFDLGYFTINAFDLISQASAYFLSRLNHQTNLYAGDTPGLPPLDLVKILTYRSPKFGVKSKIALSSGYE